MVVELAWHDIKYLTFYCDLGVVISFNFIPASYINVIVTNSSQIASAVHCCFVSGDINLLCHTELSLFAGECILYKQIKSPADKWHTVMQQDSLCSWSLQWHINFNVRKFHTTCILQKCMNRCWVTSLITRVSIQVYRSFYYQHLHSSFLHRAYGGDQG